MCVIACAFKNGRRSSETSFVVSLFGTRYILLSVLVAESGVVMEIWNNIPGSNIMDLKQDKRFPNKPDSASVVPTMATKVNIGDNYGLRLTAYYKVNATI